MTASDYVDSLRQMPVALANAEVEERCGIAHFFDDDVGASALVTGRPEGDRGEYGDWQTSMDLATGVCRLLKAQGAHPQVIVEPTCGRGHFILAALQTFDSVEEVYGIEIHRPYLLALKMQLLQQCLDHRPAKRVKIHLCCHNVFDFDFQAVKPSIGGRTVLVLGNPPWVTNSQQGGRRSDNVPCKSNFKHVKGLDAITGKGNFDIAESITHQMMSLLAGERASLALLLKNSVIRNVVHEQGRQPFPVSEICQYPIDAKREFGAAVAASLLLLRFGGGGADTCRVVDFYTSRPLPAYGWREGHFVADLAGYDRCGYMDGVSPLQWRSGVKHDCAKVMELTRRDGLFVNGFGERVDIEDAMLYPLLKSSDLKGDGITATRKYVIATQHAAADGTAWIEHTCPQAWRYLMEHAALLDGRASSIYRGRPRFCLFGIGPYSFQPYKVAISGLYKQTHFSLVEPVDGKAVILDDTCYLLGFSCWAEAEATLRVLNHADVQSFLQSLLFVDAKRVITKETLMRIDLAAAVMHIGKDNLGMEGMDWERCLHAVQVAAPVQLALPLTLST